MIRRLAFLLCLFALPAGAADFGLRGFLDARLVAPASTRSFVDGGPGKTRYGAGDDPWQFGGLGLQAHWQAAPEWLLHASAQWQRGDDPGAELVEAFVRWRPVSLTPWRQSLRFGWMFPPVSLENDGLAWTTRRTLTPAAINAWLGEEVRALAAEWRLERRGDRRALEWLAALHLGNDPTGELLAARGWSLSDLYSGVGGSVREPDNLGSAPPYRFDPYVEMDQRLGWYAGFAARSEGRGSLSLLRYDNRADPSRETHFQGNEIYAWRTRFWALGLATRTGELEWIAQAMRGDTLVRPSPRFYTATEFDAACLLASREHGAWRWGARLDWFSTHQSPPTLATPVHEHGRALTVALLWRPTPQWRVGLEWIRIDSERSDRGELGAPTRAIESQVQLSLRRFFGS